MAEREVERNQAASKFREVEQIIANQKSLIETLKNDKSGLESRLVENAEIFKKSLNEKENQIKRVMLDFDKEKKTKEEAALVLNQTKLAAVSEFEKMKENIRQSEIIFSQKIMTLEEEKRRIRKGSKRIIKFIIKLKKKKNSIKTRLI